MCGIYYGKTRFLFDFLQEKAEMMQNGLESPEPYVPESPEPRVPEFPEPYVLERQSARVPESRVTEAPKLQGASQR